MTIKPSLQLQKKSMKKSTKTIFLLSFLSLLILSIGGCVSWWKSWNAPKTMLQKRKLIESSLVLLHSKDNYIPLQNLSKDRKVVVSLAEKPFSIFEENINLYADFTTLHIIPSEDSLKLAADFQSLGNFDELIFLVGKSGKEEYVLNSTFNFIARQISVLASAKPVSVVVFENRNFIKENQKQILKSNAILFCPVYNSTSEELSAQLLCGGIGAIGILEDDILPNFKKDAGIFTQKNRLKYTIPEEVGIKSKRLTTYRYACFGGNECKSNAERTSIGCCKRKCNLPKSIWFSYLRFHPKSRKK